jgi:hypothetical protein
MDEESYSVLPFLMTIDTRLSSTRRLPVALSLDVTESLHYSLHN